MRRRKENSKRRRHGHGGDGVEMHGDGVEMGMERRWGWSGGGSQEEVGGEGGGVSII